MIPPSMNVSELFWTKYSLADIMEIIGGGTPKTTNPDYWDGDIPWLSVKDFNNDLRYVYDTEKTITQIGLENSSTNLLNKDDIIISARGTVGELALIPFPMAFNQSCYGIRAKGNLVDQIYLYYLLKDCIQDLKQNTHGSVFDTITRDTFASIEISLPPLPAQKKIAAILSSLDDKIEINTRMNKVLEEIARALFHRWFVEFEFPNDEGKPYKSSGGRMIESEMGEIPEGWRVVTVEDIADLNPESWSNRNRPKSINYLDLSNVRNGNIQNILSCPFGVAPSRARRILRIGDTIIGTVRPGNRSFALVPETGLTGSTGFAVLRSHNMSTQYYLYLHLTQNSMIQTFTQLATGGAYPAITPQLIVEQTILLPSKENLSLFHENMSAIFHRINMNAREIRFLGEIREHLLPKLLPVQE